MSSLLKFLAGIFLLQGGTVLLGIAALKNDQLEVHLLLSALALTLGLITALWFVSIAGAARKEGLAQARHELSREREELRVRVEQDKAHLVEQAHRRVSRERNRAQNRANLKVGAALVGVGGLGMVMVLTQFVTLGLLTLMAGGGAVAGYFVRVRQELRRRGVGVPRLPRTIERPVIPGEVPERPTLPRA